MKQLFLGALHFQNNTNELDQNTLDSGTDFHNIHSALLLCLSPTTKIYYFSLAYGEKVVSSSSLKGVLYNMLGPDLLALTVAV